MFVQSSKARKQRKFRFTAPLHVKQKFAHAHISKDLAKKLGIKKRSIAVREGDMVKVMVGKHRGKTGKVSSVELSSGRVYIEGIARKTMKGKEKLIPISSSNVYLIDLEMSDKLRVQKLDQFKIKVQVS